MKKFFTLILSFTLFFEYIIAQQAGLPHWMTEEEKAMMPDFLVRDNITRGTNPPAWEPRAMAEWEEIQGLLVTWTSYTTIIREIIDAAQEECVVYIVCTDSNSVKSTLTANGVPLTNLRFFEYDFDSVWSRDYGQWNIYRNDVEELSLIDWIYNRPSRPNDDAIPVELANDLNLPTYEMIQSPDDLVHTGGNFMVDGHGTGFSSKLILDENGQGNTFGVTVKNEQDIKNIMDDYVGLDRYILMETLPYDEIHHIDMHMKLLNEETLLVGEFPQGESDGPQIEYNIQYITDNFLTCYGRPYKIVRIPMPPSTSGAFAPSAYYRTYTNSVFVNKTIILPTYRTEYDTTAIRIYKENCPGYKVVPIDCDDGGNPIISALGAIHCITKEVGHYDPIWIDHAPLQSTTDVVNDYLVEAKIKSPSGISNATLYWTNDTSLSYLQVPMTFVGNDTFYAYIPAQSTGTEIFYYINANSTSGRSISKPLTAPDGFLLFEILNPTGVLTQESVPLLFDPYPNPVTSTLTIGFSIPEFSKCSISIIDMFGREVWNQQRSFEAGNWKLKLDVASLAKGAYLVKMKVNGQMSSRMLIIQ